MKNRILVTAIALLTALSATSLSMAAHDGHHDSKKKSVENLSPELRALLAQEMLALQAGMIGIIPAFAAGDFDTISEIGMKMKNSFILRQAITQEQMHELHSTLPKSFIMMDKKFHYFAGMLSHTAKRKKVELVNFYFSKLTESCVACHSQFATHKFPGLASGKKMGGHHGEHHKEHHGDSHGERGEEHESEDEEHDDDHDDHDDH